jgi:hypothetical protein
MESKHTVQNLDNCVLVFGSFALADFTALTEGIEGAVCCPTTARRYGASLAFGLPDDIDALLASAPDLPLPAGAEHLPEAAQIWLKRGERGTSSDAMFDAIFDGNFASRHAGVRVPLDCDDFKRCRLLAEAVGLQMNRGAMQQIAALSPKWANIVFSWTVLCDAMDNEAPDWRGGVGRGRVVNAMLAQM